MKLEMISGNSSGLVLTCHITNGKYDISVLQNYRNYFIRVFPPYWDHLLTYPWRNSVGMFPCASLWQRPKSLGSATLGSTLDTSLSCSYINTQHDDGTYMLSLPAC